MPQTLHKGRRGSDRWPSPSERQTGSLWQVIDNPYCPVLSSQSCMVCNGELLPAIRLQANILATKADTTSPLREDGNSPRENGERPWRGAKALRNTKKRDTTEEGPVVCAAYVPPLFPLTSNRPPGYITPHRKPSQNLDQLDLHLPFTLKTFWSFVHTKWASVPSDRPVRYLITYLGKNVSQQLCNNSTTVSQWLLPYWSCSINTCNKDENRNRAACLSGHGPSDQGQ